MTAQQGPENNPAPRCGREWAGVCKHFGTGHHLCRSRGAHDMCSCECGESLMTFSWRTGEPEPAPLRETTGERETLADLPPMTPAMAEYIAKKYGGTATPLADLPRILREAMRETPAPWAVPPVCDFCRAPSTTEHNTVRMCKRCDDLFEKASEWLGYDPEDL